MKKRGVVIGARYIISIGIFLFFSVFVSSVDISSCQALSANTYYNLTQNISFTTGVSCFTVSNNNITVDCQGYSINGNNTAAKYAFYLNSPINTTIKNCRLVNWTGGYGIQGNVTNLYVDNVSSTSVGVAGIIGATNLTINNCDLPAVTVSGASHTLHKYNIYNSKLGNLTTTGMNLTVANSTLNALRKGAYGTAYVNASNITILNYVELGQNGTYEKFIFSDTSTYLELSASNAILSFFNITSIPLFNFYSTTSSNITLINSTFKNIGNFTISPTALTSNLILRDNYFENITKLSISKKQDLIVITNNFTNVGQNYGGTLGRTISFDANANINISNNYFNNVSIMLLDTNGGHVSNNELIYKKITTSDGGAARYSNNLMIHGNKFTDSIDYGMTMISINNSNFYDNVFNNSMHCWSSSVTANSLVYNNTCRINPIATGSHCFMMNTNSTNISMFNNSAYNCAFSYLFEWATKNSFIYNNFQYGGGLFYSLHDTHDNTAYNNYVEGNFSLFDNVTNEYYRDMYITGNLLFNWDPVLGPEKTGAFNNTLENIIAEGNLSMEGNSTNNVFINVTWNGGGETLSSVNPSSYFRKWHYLALVNDSNGNTINGANVSVYNNSGNLVFSFLTNSSGLIGQQNLTEYFANSTARYYSTNYTLNVTKIGYTNYSSIFNLTTNLQSIATLSENIAPNVTLISPVNSYSETSSSSTINFQFNVSDESNLMNCTLYLNGVSYSNTSAVNKSAINSISVSVTPASYSWYVNCTDSLLNIGNSSNRTLTISAPEVESISSGGGSPVYTASIDNLAKGYTQFLYKNYQVKFSIKNESHNLKVTNVSNGSFTIVVSSTPQTFVLRAGEEKKISLVNSSYYDLLVKLNSVYLNRGNFTIQSINEKIIVENHTAQEINKDVSQPQIIEEETRSFAWAWILVLALIVLVGIFILLKKHRK